MRFVKTVSEALRLLLLLLLPLALSQQPDNPSFSDEKGFACTEWAGFDCSAAMDQYSYSAAGQAALLQNCQTTCSWWETAAQTEAPTTTADEGELGGSERER